MNNKFKGIFWNACIYFCLINNFKNKKIKLLIYRYSEIIGYTHLFPLHNEPSLMPVGWKLGGVGFEVTRNVTFQKSSLYNMYYRKINNYTSRTNKRHKSVVFLGYPSNIFAYPSRYCNYTSKKKLGPFPHSPHPSL